MCFEKLKILTYLQNINCVITMVCFLILVILNYESMITHLQETWKTQNKVACSSTINYVVL